jgi:hypothetical protein
LSKRPQAGREANQFRPQLETLEQRWVPTQSGSIAMMSAGAQGFTIFITSTHDIGLVDNVHGTSVAIGTNGSTVQVSAGTDAGNFGVQIYALLSTGDIWTEDLGTGGAAIDLTSNCGCATQVSAGYGGTVAGVAGGHVWVNSSGSPSGWAQVNTGGLGIRQISLGENVGNVGNELWILSSSGNVFWVDLTLPNALSNGPAVVNASGLSGEGRFITAGVNGEAFVLTTSFSSFEGNVWQVNDSGVATRLNNSGLSFSDAIELAAGAFTFNSSSPTENQLIVLRNDGVVIDWHESGTGRAGSGATETSTDVDATHVAADNFGDFTYTDSHGNVGSSTEGIFLTNVALA